jgi:hypothetical protein
MQLKSTCMAVVSRNGESYVLLKFEPRNSYFLGEIAKELGEFKQGKIYRITIEEGE